MNIAIIEDLDTDRDIISRYVQTYFSKYCIHMPLSVQTFENGQDFLRIFTRNSFDIIFIDYYLDHLTGLDVAYAVREKDCSVKLIFTTASRDFAVESYNVQASGYLVKPISFEAFAKIVSMINFKGIKEQQFIGIKSGYNMVKIPLNDIIYCDVAGHYVQIHTLSSGIQCARMTFAKLKNLLTPYPEFLLCYRGCIINMGHVDHIEYLNFCMSCGERIPFRKKDNSGILKAYSEFLFDKVRSQRQ